MGVKLKKLELYNFRNHQVFCIDEPQELITVIGANATGKTNIIEAIQLVSMLESFRCPHWEDVVTNNKEEGSVKAQFLQNGRLLDITMTLRENRRYYSLNEKRKNISELRGLIPAVIFVPDDLMLVKASSELRRRLLDTIGKQLSSTYASILNDYQRVVRQRNAIFRTQKNGASALHHSLQESWDENLVSLGSLLFVHRMRLYKRLMDKSSLRYQQFSEHEELTSAYLPSFNRQGCEYSDKELIDIDKDEVESLLRRDLNAVHNEEWIRGKTLVGPHRDEIVFFINGRKVKDFGSQGQQRGVALALKLAQLDLVYEISGNQPLLLLDDVMSELDEKRRWALIQAIKATTQTIITATDLAYFNQDLLRDAQVIELRTKEKAS